jgi:hypothetical protein
MRCFVRLLVLAVACAAVLAGRPELALARPATRRVVPARLGAALRTARPATKGRAPRAAKSLRPAAGARHPLSTYRLQLTPSFPFARARKVMPGRPPGRAGRSRRHPDPAA